MIGKRTEDSRPAGLAEVQKLLEARSGESDFGYEQQTSLDYAKKFAKLTPENADKLAKGLQEIEGVNSDAAVKIADIMPTSPSQLIPILAKEKAEPSEALSKKIMEVVDSFRQ